MHVENIIIAFITGLTTGGLSCLAVQGGLLASSLASQIEKDNRVQARTVKKKRAKSQAARPKPAMPILIFLFAKLIAYTVLGFFLGLVGQMIQLTPFTRAILLIAIGIFMLGNALRMLNIHPVFRYFAFEPPAFIRRQLRKRAAGTGDSPLLTPAILGLLTVLIPCGVTQIMMAAALGTGNPVLGSALMFAFTLGTCPVFFAVAYFTTHLGAKLEKHFMSFVAIVVLILALVTIDNGVTLAGSPISLARLLNRGVAGQLEGLSAPAGGEAADLQNPSAGSGVLTVSVKNNGYYPDVLYARAGMPVRLDLVSENVYSCARAFIIPVLGVDVLLEATGTTTIDIPAQSKGTRIPFSCSMGMFTGTIIFDL